MKEIILENNDFSKYESRKDLILEKIDRNGTHIYNKTCKCGKCGGTGYIPTFNYIDNGKCFACNGTGIFHDQVKVLSKDYACKLEKKRKEKAMEKTPELNSMFLEKNGFSKDGKTWLVLGNTFDIKDDIKSKGAKYTEILGWVFPFYQNDYESIEISIDTKINGKEIIYQDNLGRYNFNVFSYEVKDFKKEQEVKRQNKKSEYIGTIGEQVTLIVTLERNLIFENRYGYTNMYIMKNQEKNIVIWNTQKDISDMIDIEKKFSITGRIKEQKVYNHEKQTVLTRCKVKDC